MQTFHEYFGLEYNSINKVIFLYLVALLLALARCSSSTACCACRSAAPGKPCVKTRSPAVGLNPTVIKLSAFTLGASPVSPAASSPPPGPGDPESFTFIESAIILAIVVLGGMGSQLGVILAAIVMILLPEMMREFSEYRMLMFGALMVLMMIWRPQGLLPMQRPHMELRK
jgi:branched-chain amino acid transport system permease protein